MWESDHPKGWELGSGGKSDSRSVCGMGMGLCDRVKVRPRGTAISDLPVEGAKPGPKCMGLRLELSGRDRMGWIKV